MPKVSVHIVTWNSRRYIENAMRSLMEQTFKEFSVLIVDNGSTDNTVSWLKEYYPQIKIVQNTRNLGFAKGHNQAISFTKSDYVLVMNIDTILKEDYLERLVAYLDKHPRIGSLTGKVYRLIGDPGSLTTESFTKIFDNTGLQAYKSRRFTERGAGEFDNGQYDTIEEIFGVSGALGFYRRRALDEIMVNREFFDDDFFFYKEDVDLAWRLRLMNWSSVYLPNVIGYHHRQVKGDDQQSDIAILKNRLKKPSYSQKVSYWNHLWILVKNEQNFWRDSIFILWYELKKLVYILLFEQKTLLGLVEFFKLLPKMRAKRKVIQSRAKVSAREMRRWFR